MESQSKVKDELRRKQIGRTTLKAIVTCIRTEKEKKCVKQGARSNHHTQKNHGPRVVAKQKHPFAWSSGIIPPPLLVSIASNSLTTSSMSGRFSAFASQHFRMILANELGQHRGISGRKFCPKSTQKRVTSTNTNSSRVC